LFEFYKEQGGFKHFTAYLSVAFFYAIFF